MMSLVKVFLFVGCVGTLARPDDTRIIGGKEVSTLLLCADDDDRQLALYVIMS